MKYSDIPMMLDLAEQCHHESPHYRYLEFNRDQAAELMLTYVGANDRVGIVGWKDEGFVGFIAGHIEKYQYGPSLIAFEDTFVIRPEHRGSRVSLKMAKAFVIWAKIKRVSKLQAGTSTGYHIEAMKRFYERQGLHHAGHVLAMEVNDGRK